MQAQSHSSPISSTEDAFDAFIDRLVNTHTNMFIHTNTEDFLVFVHGTYTNGKFDLLPEPKIYTNLAGLKRPCAGCKADRDKAINSLSEKTLPTPKGDK